MADLEIGIFNNLADIFLLLKRYSINYKEIVDKNVMKNSVGQKKLTKNKEKLIYIMKETYLAHVFWLPTIQCLLYKLPIQYFITLIPRDTRFKKY